MMMNIKKYISNIMKNFIRNSYQQQEIIISLHFFLVTVCIAVMFPYKYNAIFLALCILLVLGGVVLLIPRFVSFSYNVYSVSKQKFNFNLPLLTGGFFLFWVLFKYFISCFTLWFLWFILFKRFTKLYFIF